MARTKRKWTKEEEEILVRVIKNNPHNLRQCFKEVSKKIDRTLSAVEFHWYAVLNNPRHPKYVGTSFLIIGRKTYCKNKKISNTDFKNIPSKKISLWNKIKSLFI